MMLQVQPKLLYVPLATFCKHIINNTIDVNQQILKKINAKCFTCYIDQKSYEDQKYFSQITENIKLKNTIQLFEKDLVCFMYWKNDMPFLLKNVLSLLDKNFPDNNCIMVDNFYDYTIARKYLSAEDVYDIRGNNYYV